MRRRRAPRREKYALLGWPKGTFREIMRGKRMIANAAGMEEIHGNQVELLPSAANCFVEINPINPRTAAETAADLVSAARIASAALRAGRGRTRVGRDDLAENVLELRCGLRKLTHVGRHWLGRTKDDLDIAPSDRYDVVPGNKPGSVPMLGPWIRHARWAVCDAWKVRGKVPLREWEFLVATANACLDISTRNPLVVAEHLPAFVKACQRTVAASRAHTRRTKRQLPTRARQAIEALQQQLKRMLTRLPEGN